MADMHARKVLQMSSTYQIDVQYPSGDEYSYLIELPSSDVAQAIIEAINIGKYLFSKKRAWEVKKFLEGWIRDRGGNEWVLLKGDAITLLKSRAHEVWKLHETSLIL